MDIKIGQAWQDKDKRRPKKGTVKHINSLKDTITVDLGDRTQEYTLSRFSKRWELIDEPKQELKTKHKTREAWLEDAVKTLKRSIFKDLTYEMKGEPEPVTVTIPEVRVSVGWPGGRGPKATVIGQCWKSHTAGDKVIQVFISPVVDDPLKALATLAHELIHASDDGASGHRGHFTKVAKAIGFVPKYTEVNMDDDLKEVLEAHVPGLGAYPHSAIRVQDKPKVQKTYMIKLGPGDCDDCDPDYKIRMTEKWLEESGAPLCPHGVEMEEA